MAFGVGEDPSRSPAAQLDMVEFPTSRDELVRLAEENGGHEEVINLFLSLPREQYGSKEEVLRDLAEAARRFATFPLGADEDGANRDRRNIGRDLVEGAPEGMTKHP
jgi:hypothetical protein